ncbi:MAG TPA: hypothetical protein VHX61_08360 [Rhizomicrobium sp.]|jgi:hypothetical protein|nr:hypothetical protein [Rhizomicrobium sp.]
MNTSNSRRRERFDRVAKIIRDAGGEIVGRTRLQKTAYLLSVAGFEDAFRFGYKYYGPFSESLAEAAEFAAAFDRISETQQAASWGGTYSIYRAQGGQVSGGRCRVQLATEAARADAVLLELAATAAYLPEGGLGTSMDANRAAQTG